MPHDYSYIMCIITFINIRISQYGHTEIPTLTHTHKTPPHTDAHTQACHNTQNSRWLSMPHPTILFFLLWSSSLQHIPLNLKEYCFSDISQSVTLLTNPCPHPLQTRNETHIRTHAHTHTASLSLSHTHTDEYRYLPVTWDILFVLSGLWV